MKPTHKHLFLLVCFVTFLGCNTQKEESGNDLVQQLLPDTPAEVTVAPLKTVDFEHELVSNGKISAKSIAEVKFNSPDIIISVMVKNGDRVKKGQTLAVLDTYELENRLNQAKDALDRSRLDMQDVLIGQGYKLDSLDRVPEEIMQLARIKSGYNTASTNYTMAQRNLERATLTAPIDGIVANLYSKANTIANPSELLCNIINTGTFEISFTVLENELDMIRTGDRVTVTPFSMPEVKVEGQVSEMNPWVDNNGMVKVKASINYNNRLVEGMNARVSIFRKLEKQWVVPKAAVVLRTGRQVVFVLSNGKAIWNYVDTGLENATEYTITSETLKEGDTIIVSGNINLAHESPVKVVEND